MNYRGTQYDVVPYVGTWIEIRTSWMALQNSMVVPYVGTWIEMSLSAVVES